MEDLILLAAVVAEASTVVVVDLGLEAEAEVVTQIPLACDAQGTGRDPQQLSMGFGLARCFDRENFIRDDALREVVEPFER